MGKLNKSLSSSKGNDDVRGITQTIREIDLNDKSRQLNAKRMIDANGRSIEYNEKKQF